MTLVSVMPSQTASLLEDAKSLGFDKLIYSVDMLDGDIDPPLEAIGWGLSGDFWERYLNGIREDPLRRMAARGEIVVGNIPVPCENDGASLSIARQKRFSAGDASMLRWLVSQGHRTGVSFRVRMSQGRHASLNFFSAQRYGEAELNTAMRGIFMIGHQVHASLEPHVGRVRGQLLSNRESECLEWIAYGKSNREIAQLLGISADTVKEHVHSLFNKLSVSCRAQAVSKGHALAYLG